MTSVVVSDGGGNIVEYVTVVEESQQVSVNQWILLLLLLLPVILFICKNFSENSNTLCTSVKIIKSMHTIITTSKSECRECIKLQPSNKCNDNFHHWQRSGMYVVASQVHENSSLTSWWECAPHNSPPWRVSFVQTHRKCWGIFFPAIIDSDLMSIHVKLVTSAHVAPCQGSSPAPLTHEAGCSFSFSFNFNFIFLFWKSMTTFFVVVVEQTWISRCFPQTETCVAVFNSC